MIIFNRTICSDPHKFVAQLNLAREEIFPESEIVFDRDSVYAPKLLSEQLNMIGASQGQYFDDKIVVDMDKLIEKLNLLFAI